MTTEYSADAKCVAEPLLGTKSLQTSFPRVIFLGFIIATPSIVAGMTLAFSAIALPQMDLDIDEASWYGSMPNFGSPVGSILIGLVVDRFGRKKSFVIGIIPSIIGWFCLSAGFSITIAFVGRFLTGLAAGGTFISQIYAAECITVNHNHLRNSFTTWNAVALCTGVLLTSILSLIAPYQHVASVATVISIVSFVAILVFIPESPQWLYHRGMVKEAARSEKKLRIRQPVLEDARVTPAKGLDIDQHTQGITTIIKKLKQKDVYKPLFIMSTWLIMIMFTGGPAINSYTVDIISIQPEGLEQQSPYTDATENNKSAYGLTVVTGVMSMVAVSLTSVIVSHTGIKKLFFYSSSGLTFGMVALGASISLMSSSNLQEFFNAIHVVSVWLISFFYTLGVVTVPISVLGEMFPYGGKGFASIPLIVNSIACAAAIKLHPYLYESFGSDVFFLYAIINVANIIFMLICVPETVGKSLDEIGERFRK